MELTVTPDLHLSIYPPKKPFHHGPIPLLDGQEKGGATVGIQPRVYIDSWFPNVNKKLGIDMDIGPYVDSM